MPRILEELYECRVCGFEPTNRLCNYEKHCRTIKHKSLMKPELAKKLADVKREKKELKFEVKQLAFEKTIEVKQLQMEKELELEQMELEIKEQIKEQAKPERVITKSEMENSKGMDKFMDRVALRPEIEDYMNLYYGYITFQELFKRDFSAEYEEDKVFVIDKGQKDICYWINNAPCHWFGSFNEKNYSSCRIFYVITHYYNMLKEYAGQNGCKVTDFKLEETDKKELEEWMKEEMTFLFSYKS
jgi:hypothetical protein